MYCELLKIALDQSSEIEDQLTTAGTLATYLQSHAVLDCEGKHDRSRRSPMDGLFKELDHDLALIRLAQLFGIAIDVRAFVQPAIGRERLEQALVDRGIRLDELMA